MNDINYLIKPFGFQVLYALRKVDKGQEYISVSSYKIFSAHLVAVKNIMTPELS